MIDEYQRGRHDGRAQVLANALARLRAQAELEHSRAAVAGGGYAYARGYTDAARDLASWFDIKEEDR